MSAQRKPFVYIVRKSDCALLAIQATSLGFSQQKNKFRKERFSRIFKVKYIITIIITITAKLLG